MIFHNLTEINKDIKLRLYKPVYLLFGTQAYLVERYLGRLIKSILPDGTNMFNHTKLDTKPVDMLRLEEALNQLPVYGHTITLLNDFDLTAQGDKDLDKLVSLMQEIGDGNILIIVIRDECDAKKSGKAKKLLAAVEKYGSVYPIELNTKGDLVDLIRTRGERHGCEISVAVATELIDWCSDSVDVLIHEVDKLCLYAKDRPITTQMVWEICSISIEGNIYQIAKHILLSKPQDALNEISALLYNKVDPIRIVTTLGYSFSDLYKVKAGMIKGKSAEEISKELKLKSAKIVSYMMKDIKRIDLNKLGEINILILDTEYKLKTLPYQSRILLEQMVIETMRILGG